MANIVRASQIVVEALVNDTPPTSTSARVSQVVVQALVNDSPFPGTDFGGVNTGTPVCSPYNVKLDRKVRVTGVHAAGTTTWTLPYTDSSCDTIVLSDTAFGATNGTVLTGTPGTLQITKAGNYSAGFAIIGRPYTMSVELTRPFRRNQNGEAIPSDRIQLGVFYASYRDTGDLTVRAQSPAAPARSDRSRAFAAAVGTTVEENEIRFLLSGKAEETRVFLENATPRPSKVTAVRFTGEYQEAQG